MYLTHDVDGHVENVDRTNSRASGRTVVKAERINLLIELGIGLWVASNIVIESAPVEAIINSTASLHWLFRFFKLSAFLFLALGEIWGRKYVAQTHCSADHGGGLFINREDLLYICVSLVLLFEMVLVKSSLLLQMSAVIYVSRNIKKKRILTAHLLGILVPLVAITLLVVFGAFPEGVQLGESAARAARDSIGFSWPSRVPNMLLAVLMLIVLMKQGDTENWTLLLAVLAGIVIFRITDSKNPFVFTVALAFGVAILKSTRTRINRGALRACGLVFLWCAAVCVLLSAYYSPKVGWMSTLNDALSQRLLYSHAAFTNESISLFGTNTYFTADLTPDTHATVGYLDSGYLNILFHYGWTVGGAYLVLLMAITWNEGDRGNSYIVLVALIIALHALAEGQISTLVYTPILWYTPELLYRSRTYMQSDCHWKR